MKRLLTFVLLALVFGCASTSFAQLTHQQKVADFKALVALYNKNYGPYEWKLKAFNYDLLNIEPWLDQVNSSTDDLSFYDICVRYVASLHDSHDEVILPSYYEAYLPITADIYDGKVLIDFIDRTVLDPQTYPFSVGDELLAVDGKSVGQWVSALAPYSVNGEANPESRDRLAVGAILDRYQGWYTYANKVNPGDTATIVVKSGGKVASYALPWFTIGIPLDQEGPVPNPNANALAHSAFSQSAVKRPMRQMARAARNAWGQWTGASAPRPAASSTPGNKLRDRMRNFSALHTAHVVAGGIYPFGSPFPLFNPPPGFQLRLGANPTDEFLSGTFPVGNRTIGFIRIPSFEPLSEGNALAQFQNEITYFEQNTNGLVVDLMSNGGGDACYANFLAQYLSPKPFNALRLEIRATEEWILEVENFLLEEEFAGAPQGTLNLIAKYLAVLQQTAAENRGLTPPIPLLGNLFCTGGGGIAYPPATDGEGNNVAYTKPIVVLTDNFTLSAAEFFSATLQDAKAITVYGVRTDGGGGNVVEFDYNSMPYAEGSARVTQSLGVRNHVISAPGLPPGPFIENLGIQADVWADYQTRANLFTGGQPFVNGFSALIYKLTNGH